MKKTFLLFVFCISIFIVKPVLAQIQESYVQAGEEINNGYLRVYYVNQSGDKVFVSPEGQNSKQASREGDYIVWVTEINDHPGQVFIYHIPSETITQLTSTGTNLNPRIENGLVVWEGWIDNKWQVFLYDGTGVKQLTSGDMSINPDIEGDNIIMARRDSAGTWRSSLYSILDGSFADISTGQKTKHPHLEKKNIFHEDEEFPLITDDIYLLGFEAIPESVDAAITEDDVLKEIYGPDTAQLNESTPSADLTSPPSN